MAAGHRAITDLLRCERRVRGIRYSRMRHVDADRLPHKKVVIRQRRWHPQRKIRPLRRVQMVAPRQFVNHLPTTEFSSFSSALPGAGLMVRLLVPFQERRALERSKAYEDRGSQV
jgi:hypothetical protein